MPDEPLVSVVMTVYQPHPRYFSEAVASVLAETHHNLELVIVEDPSSQSAAELLKQFDDPRIVHHCNPERTSHLRQRNLSLEMAKSEFVATIDADDICHPERIAKQLRFLRENPDVAVVGSNLTVIDGEGAICGSRSYPQTPEDVLKTFPIYNPIAQPAVMFRKSVIMAAGAYQYERFPAVEDYELWSRLATQGVKFANLQEPLISYRLHGGAMKATKLRGILNGTLAVKRRYWRKSMGVRGHIRMAAEHCLLILPAAFTYQLFAFLVLRRRTRAR